MDEEAPMAFVDDTSEERESFRRIVDCTAGQHHRTQLLSTDGPKRTLILITSFGEELFEVEPVVVGEA
jgi:hypothetical protein